jgi:hypothetical protein
MYKGKETVADINRLVERRIREWENDAKRLRKKFPELSKFRSEDMILYSIHLALGRMYAMGVR